MKKILIALLLLAVVGGVIGIFWWNKPHRKAEDEKAIAVTAVALYDAYKANEQSANQLYLNKLVAVTGELESQEKNQDGQTVVILKVNAGDDLMAGAVMCTLRDKNVQLPSGPTLTLKGFCNGFANDVHLSDCIIANP